MTRREFHLTDGSTDQFWAIALHPTAYTLHYGRQGTAGQQETREFDTPEAALADYERAIAARLAQGYMEVHPTHFLQEALDRIKRCIVDQAPAMVSQFQPGLSRTDFDAKVAAFPYHLPDEVYQLFSWHNGIQETQELGLLPGYLFLPLETCLAEYRQTIEVYQSLPGVGQWEDLYDPHWFPVFCEEGNYYVVKGANAPQATAPILDKFSEDPDVRVLFDNLTQMMQAIAECWETGLYRMEQTEDGDYWVEEEEPTATQRIWLKYQSQRAAQVEVLLTGEASTLTPTERQTAYADLVATNHPETLAVLHSALQTTCQEDLEHCCALIYQVGQLRSPAAATTLLPYLNHTDLQVRYSVVSALVWAIGYDVLQQTPDLDQWVEPVLQLLSLEDGHMRRGDVVTLLGMMGDRRALIPLLHQLNQPSPDLFGRDTQFATIKALVRLNDPAVADSLHQLAWSNSDPTICLAAGRALRALGDERGLEVIHRLIQADLPSISDVARRILALDPQEFLKFG